MIELTIGRPGECKSLDQAKTIDWLLRRAYKTEKKYKLFRKVFVNLHLKVDAKFSKYLFYFDDLFELTKEKDCDIVIDEIAVYLPSDKWKDTHFEVRRMLAQHRKRGIEIYANTQDFRMVDINFRRMIHKVFKVKKVIGNRNPSKTRPPIKHIWGVYIKRELDIELLEETDKKENFSIPNIEFIRRKFVEMYDTTEDIKPVDPPPLHHYVRKCATCDFKKTYHV